MEYALEERIGNPDLFTGRKTELSYFLEWINNIKERKSQSTAILARRKMGKTALMERLFNITFQKNDGVIPFYYEVKETKKWVGDFCVDFFLTFIYQYIAFKTRNTDYLNPVEKNNFDTIAAITQKEGFNDLTALIKSVEYSYRHGNVDILWDTVRDAPKTIASRQKEFILQMIDEFQFLNCMIYWDKGKDKVAGTLAGGYLSTAESKIAPLLVSGSWVGWLMSELTMMLPARFKYKYFINMPEDEAVEMVFKYSRFFDVPISGELAYMVAELSEGSPFYIASIMRSECTGKDLTTTGGLIRVLEFETLDDRGNIKSTWMEYVTSALPRINDQNAKNIVLYLCKHREREVTRKELIEELQLNITDAELERRLKALVKADIINQGRTNFDYQGVRDNIFDKVFRGVYEKEIREFDVSIIGKEYSATLAKMKKQYKSLQGKLKQQKGYFAEYLILDRLKFHSRKENELLKSFTRYLPGDFEFCDYSRVWRYDSSPVYSRGFNVDVFAHSKNKRNYSIIGEVKSRETKKFSKEEVHEFARKFEELKKLENIERVVGVIFSFGGFTKGAEALCKAKGIACSEDERWLEKQTANPH
ncbi:MAG: hypothetical protein GY757_32580 [bacterium]|nr:hypothetical protein [bacterium]